MSGLEANERRIDEGAIQVSLGQGKTADVLRNLCWKVWEAERDKPDQGEWGTLVSQLEPLFGAHLNPPDYLVARGELQMSYSEIALNEADRDTVVAFVGAPHPLRHGDQLRKSLSQLGYEQFLQAEVSGWVLYLERSTDLEALRIRSLTADQNPAHTPRHGERMAPRNPPARRWIRRGL